jgi:DNA-binding transcriptional ArsR family regulator
LKILLKGEKLMSEIYPYVVFLPAKQKDKMLSAIFGSKAAVDILRFSIKQGISNKIYQKDLIEKLPYSNKTIIEHLKTLTKLGVLEEEMEKAERLKRITWVKSYRLSDLGKWFALLLAEEKALSEKEKAEILKNIFKIYIQWVKGLSEKLHVNKKSLEEIFKEEIR